MTIYIVTEGTYSDYHIEGAFSSRERADEYVKIREGEKYRYEVSVEEYELDEELKKSYITIYKIRVLLHDGRVDKEWEDRGYFKDNYSNKVIFRTEAIGESVISKEHALKLAIEARQEWLR